MIIEDELLNIKQFIINLQSRMMTLEESNRNLELDIIILAKRLKELEEENVEDAYDEIPALDRLIQLGTGFDSKTNPPVHVSLEDDELQDLEDRVLRGYN
jgi:hypothetical protein